MVLTRSVQKRYFKVWAKVAAFKWHSRFLTQKSHSKCCIAPRGSLSQWKISEQPMSVGKGPAGILSWRPAGPWTPPSGCQAEPGSGARADGDLAPAWSQEGECFAVCAIPSCQQDCAQSAEEIRAARDFPLLKGQNQVWLFPYVFESWILNPRNITSHADEFCRWS